MKTTIKLKGTTYTLSSGHATYETKHLTDEQRLQLRVNEITLLANRKHRKPALKKCPRVYPKFGAVMSVESYVYAYWQANGFKDSHNDFFAPLAKHVPQPQGEDTQEQEA